MNAPKVSEVCKIAKIGSENTTFFLILLLSKAKNSIDALFPKYEKVHKKHKESRQ
jgi:hypothetical protein